MKKLSLALIILAPLLLAPVITLLRHPSTSPSSNAIAPLDLQHLSGNYDPLDTYGFFHDQVYSPPQTYAQLTDVPSRVLGQNTSPKRIEIDLTNQRLYAYEGDRQIYNFLVSTGKWGRTPTGHFQIWVKLRYTKMEGGSKALHTYYYLPNVPYTMYFYNDQTPKYRGYGIHGTYWHSNFGHPMSHGCINMQTDQAGLLYYWAQPDLEGKQSIWASDNNPGTPVLIYGQTPTS
jgi:hypothetical protein